MRGVFNKMKTEIILRFKRSRLLQMDQSTLLVNSYKQYLFQLKLNFRDKFQFSNISGPKS
jgi:hypothetical protein